MAYSAAENPPINHDGGPPGARAFVGGSYNRPLAFASSLAPSVESQRLLLRRARRRQAVDKEAACLWLRAEERQRVLHRCSQARSDSCI